MGIDITRLDNQQLQRIEKGLDNIARAMNRQAEATEVANRTLIKLLEVAREEKNGAAGQDRGPEAST